MPLPKKGVIRLDASVFKSNRSAKRRVKEIPTASGKSFPLSPWHFFVPSSTVNVEISKLSGQRPSILRVCLCSRWLKAGRPAVFCRANIKREPIVAPLEPLTSIILHLPCLREPFRNPALVQSVNCSSPRSQRFNVLFDMSHPRVLIMAVGEGPE